MQYTLDTVQKYLSIILSCALLIIGVSVPASASAATPLSKTETGQTQLFLPLISTTPNIEQLAEDIQAQLPHLDTTEEGLPVLGPDRDIGCVPPFYWHGYQYFTSLRYNDKSTNVWLAQWFLMNRHNQSLAPYGADRHFGRVTQNAVITVQQYWDSQGYRACGRSITENGTVGPQTWAILIYMRTPKQILTHDEAMAQLRRAGIEVNKTEESGKLGCRQSDCTTFEGIRQESISGLIDLKRRCNCPIVVTGGTENGHAGGTYSHGNGYKIDIRPLDDISNFIVNNSRATGKYAGSYPYRKDNANSIVYLDERSNPKGRHWDLCFSSHCNGQ